MESLHAGLLGHWTLATDCSDSSGNDLHGTGHSLSFSGGKARFDGIRSYMEVPSTPVLQLGTGDFSLCAWVHTEEKLADTLGDIAAKWDPATRRGFNLNIMNYAGVTSAQSNYRHLHFGVDDGRHDAAGANCGRPGNAIFVMALAVHDGHLYAGTYEAGADESGHVYRYLGGDAWEDCGSPDKANAVSSLAVYDGQLYAGVATYLGRGSALPDSPNMHPGGRIYRYAGSKRWVPCGQLPHVEPPNYQSTYRGQAVYAMAVYQGELYAMPMYSFGVYRYAGGTRWADCGHPGKRVMTLSVYNGYLYATGNEGGGLYRHDGGTTWTACGTQAHTTQVYSTAVYEGKLHVGTWPEGSVFRWDGGEQWTHCGRLGSELEVMGMMVYNGKLYAGTLPLAQVYRYDGENNWTLTGQLDMTPDVRYRRAWSMAVYQGKLFCGTLPSGTVHALQSGASVTWDRALPPGWRHVVAMRRGSVLTLSIDGKEVARSSVPHAGEFDIANRAPLRLGLGAHDYFNGALADVRVYGRALAQAEVEALAAMKRT